MTIKELITEGEQVKSKNTKSDSTGKISCISGEEYANWIAKCIIYLQRKKYNQEMTKRFIDEAKNAVGNGLEHYDKMMGILKAFDELGEE